MRQTPSKTWAGYIPMLAVGLGAGAGGWFAYAIGALETPFALLGAVGGYLVSGAALRHIYSDRE